MIRLLSMRLEEEGFKRVLEIGESWGKGFYFWVSACVRRQPAQLSVCFYISARWLQFMLLDIKLYYYYITNQLMGNLEIFQFFKYKFDKILKINVEIGISVSLNLSPNSPFMYLIYVYINKLLNMMLN